MSQKIRDRIMLEKGYERVKENPFWPFASINIDNLYYSESEDRYKEWGDHTHIWEVVLRDYFEEEFDRNGRPHVRHKYALHRIQLT